MRKCYALAANFLFVLLMVSGVSWGQLLNEDFTSLNTGNLGTQNTWVQNGSGTDVQIANTSPLTRSGYASLGGNYITISQVNGIDPHKTFTSVATSTASTFYYSFLVNVSSSNTTALTTAAAYVLSLRNTANTAYTGRFYIAKDASNNLKLGISVSGGDGSGTFATNNYLFGTTYLIVIRYDIGSTNDNMYMWVNPTITSQPSTTDANVSLTAVTKPSYSTAINSLMIHQRSATNTPVASMDGFRVSNAATSSDAWSALSASVSAPTVTTGSATSITNSDATLNGTVTSNGASTTVTFNYGTTVSYGTDATATQSPLTASASNSAVSAALTGLSANTQYNYRVSATNSAGTTNGSNQTFWTLANVPSAPTLSNATSSSIDVAINENGNPASTEFAIQEAGGNFVQADGSLGATAVWNTKSGWGTKTITGLSANTSYTFKVKARNGANTETDYGATANATTLVGTTPSASITGPVTEQQLHGYALAVTLSNETFNTNTPSATDFTLVNAPANLSIGSVTYTNNTSVTLNLNYSGDFDANITNFSVSVSKDILTSGNGGNNLSSNNITLTALTESLSVGTITAFADQAVNTVSSEKTFTVSGTVRGNVTLVPPAGFEISTQTGGSFAATNPITLSPTGTNLASTAIYVRFKPTAITSYSGDITVASAGVTNATVAVSGTGIAPANPSFTATAASETVINLTASANSNSNPIVVVFNTSGSFTTPVNGVAAGTAGSSFAGGEVLHNGTAASLSGTHTGLTGSTTYYYKVFSYDAQNFYSAGVETFATTAKQKPASQPTDLVFSSVTASSFSVAFTAATGNPDGYLVIRSTSSSLSGTPVNGTTYSVGSSLGGGTVVSAGSTVTGIANSSLSAGTTYYIFVFAYNNSGTLTDYLTTSPLSSSVLTKVAAPSPSSSNVTAVSFDLFWTAVTGADSYKLDVSTANTFASFVSGYENLTVTGTSVTVSNLSANTQYFFRMRSVNASGAGDNSSTGNITTAVLSIPTVSAADQITHNSFRANWSSVTGAESYRLDVATSFASVDDFTDGDFTSNPTWSGSTGSYAIQAVTTLNSASNTADGSYLGSTNSAGKTGLYVPSSEVSEWKFSLASTSFNPSTLNYFGVVLMSDATFSDVATSSFNGYYLKIGIDGSTDYVELWRSSGTTKTKIGDFSAIGNFGTGALQNGLNLRITRSNLGVFQVYYSSGFLFTSTPTSDGGSLTDNTHKTSSYFGVYTWFSSPGTSRIVYIDNIVLGNDVYVTDFQDKPVPSNEETVTGLTENTNYYYRVRAYSANSTTSYSATQSVTTYRDIATADFRTKASGNLSSTGTWEYNHTGSSYQDATQVPGTGNNITVQNGHILILDNSFTVGAGKALTLNAISNLIINPNATLSFTGNGNFNDQSVVLISNATGTASIGQVIGTLSGATNVTVERFIGIPTAKRAWRMLTVPLRSSTTTDVSIFNSWQENGQQMVGYGTLVTGANANPVNNGLDLTSGASMRSFVNGAWVDVTNTKTTPLYTMAASAANRSFAVFIRGDRSNLSSTSGTSTTTLKAAGALQIGRQSFEVVNNSGFTLLGNPYASPIDFNKFYLSNSDTIAREIHYWDADRSNDGTGTGGYVTASWNGNSYDYTPNGAPRKTTIIQSGMAFFVKTNGSFAATPTVSFLESHKDVASHNIFRTGSQNEKLFVDLFLQSTTGNTWSLADGFLARYHNTYNVDVINGEDAGKMLNTEENFSLKRNGNLLAIESRPLIDNDDTLFVSMSNIKQNRSYKFAFDPQNFDAPGLTAYLEDAFLNNVTPVSLSAPTEIVFTTTATAGSFAADRFRIVFKPSSTLSTTGLTVKASLVEKQVRIDWSMVNENNVKGYTVERSSDGKTFTTLTAVNAKANDNSTVSYDATDASPLNGMNYYRIKATDVNGKVTYSAIVRIKTNDTKASVTVYPNPVKGEQLNIHLNGLSKGTYTMKLYNNLGQEVYGSTLQVTQAAMSQTLNIAALKTSGVYTLRITNGDQTIEQTIVAQ